MKKLVLVVFAFVSVATATAQKTQTAAEKKKAWNKLTGRPGDHIMLQLSYDQLMGVPDSIKSHMTGIPRGFNAYVMLDKVFKGAPQFSVALGVGFSSSNFYFKRYSIDVASNNAKLPFNNLDNANHYKKYKLAVSYLEIPIELRFTLDPARDSRSIKAAVGFKIGTLLNSHNKGKNLEDKDGKLLQSLTAKETGKRFFNSTRMAATARIGYGNFTIFGSYQINNMFKDGVAPDMRVMQIGLTVSGL